MKIPGAKSRTGEGKDGRNQQHHDEAEEGDIACGGGTRRIGHETAEQHGRCQSLGDIPTRRWKLALNEPSDSKPTSRHASVTLVPRASARLACSSRS